MIASQLTLAALLVLAAAPERMLLTPDTIAEHEYHMRCVVVDQTESKDPERLRPIGPVLVHLRFGRLPGTSSKDLEPIKAVSLVARDGDAVLFSVPVHAKVDPGNRVHLYVRFSAQRDLLKKMQLVFDEDGERGHRTFVADIEAFIAQK